MLTPMPRCAAPDYWARRKRHWEGLRLAKLQRAAREAGLWEAGSVEMLRDRLLRADYDSSSLFPPEAAAAAATRPSPRSTAEEAAALPDDLELMRQRGASSSSSGGGTVNCATL